MPVLKKSSVFQHVAAAVTLARGLLFQGLMADIQAILPGTDSRASAVGSAPEGLPEVPVEAQQLFGAVLAQMLGSALPAAMQAAQEPAQGAGAPGQHAASVTVPTVQQAAESDGTARIGVTLPAGPDVEAPTPHLPAATAQPAMQEQGDDPACAGLKNAAPSVERAVADDGASEAEACVARTPQHAEAPGAADAPKAVRTQHSLLSEATQARPAMPHAQAPAETGPAGADRVLHASLEGGRLAVTIEPKGLGTMDINLSLNKGVVHAQVQVVQDSARHLIEGNLQQLLDALARDGIALGGFNVFLKERDGAGQQSSDGGHRTDEAAPDPIEAVAPALRPGPGRVSIYA